MEQEKHPLSPKKRYVCLYQVKGHRTWRMQLRDTVEAVEKVFHADKVTPTVKKFFEIDLITGTFEEF